jgi:hypothetical protein
MNKHKGGRVAPEERLPRRQVSHSLNEQNQPLQRQTLQLEFAE